MCVDGRWQACAVAPSEIACENACGLGRARCVDSVIGPCEVAPTEVACENACGAGEARCIDGVTGLCEVAPAEIACENACGLGSQECVDGVRGPCISEPVERACETRCGEGIERCEDGVWGRCSADVPRPPILAGRVRDFMQSHPDFESAIGSDPGIVEPTLGPDDRPVYAGLTPTTSGRMSFDTWYRDVEGVNLGQPLRPALRPSATDERLFVFEDTEFFPIDGALFGNEGHPHNFHFTFEASTEFIYQGGEIFRFVGDDDVFVFIDRQLAIDLGGVHATQEATVELDTFAATHGLVLGTRYPIHLFFAERHTSASRFTVETTVADTFRCE